MSGRTTALLIQALTLLVLTSTAIAIDREKLDLLQMLRDEHAAQSNTGYVFLMAHEGEVVLADHAGLAVVEHQVPMERNSRFPVMSITKAFIGTALAVAVDRGQVDLDAPIAEYLPDYPGDGADRITLRMLAAHTSGIPHTGHPDRRALYAQHFDDATSAIGVYADRSLAFEPGSDYLYSSSGYNLIAAVLEAVHELPIQRIVGRDVLQPLELVDTDHGSVERPASRLVRNYSHIDLWTYAPSDDLLQVPTWDFSYNHGGGNMVSSADDLLAFGQALLDESPWSEDLKGYWTSRAVPERSRWSLGWILGEDDAGRRTVSITGATPGVQAALYVYPDHELVFVALANCWGRDSADADLVIGAPQRIVDRYLASLEPNP
ncbi:serine hydrolase domain-containing protein [Halomonas denitrificans]|nr:beta-lactamase family protein [Halomonas denitrificans]